MQFGHMTHHVMLPGSSRQRFGRWWPPSCGQDVLGERGESAAPGQVCGSGAGDTGRETKPGRSGEAVVSLCGSGPRVAPWTACVNCEVHDPAKKSSIVSGARLRWSCIERLGCAILPN